MGLINTAISNLLGGVSQQADSLRGASNCEEQTNAYPSPIEGLVKRPATQFMGIVGNYEPETSHLIDRDVKEKYIVSVTSRTNNTSADYGQLRVWDVVNNVEKLVYYDTDALSYLVADDLINSFKFTTAGDVTYITNTEVTPLMGTTLSDAQADNGIVHVRQGASDTDYKIKIDETQIQHETPMTGDNTVKTNTIAEKLFDTLLTGTTARLHSDIDCPLPIAVDGNTVSGHPAFRINLSAGGFSNSPTQVTGQVITILSRGTAPLLYSYNNSSRLYYPIANGAKFRVYRTDSQTNPTWVELKTLSGQPMQRWTDQAYYGYDGQGAGAGFASLSLEDTSGSSSFSDYSFTRYESTILIHQTGSSDFNLEASDSVGDTYLKAFKGTSQYFSDLPESCIDGLFIKITGNAESNVDDYYVQFTTDGTDTYGKGSWVEEAAPSTAHTLNPSTMPHLLIRQEDGTFLFKPADGTTTPTNVTAGYTAPTLDAYDSFSWEQRKAGDDTTNPLPNFIGNAITDIFFYENRLGILSGESVTLSESGQFFNFFRTTVIDLLDTAPIEVVGSSNSVNILRHAVPFNGNLILFGDNTQFMLGSGSEGLSPKTVAMSQASSYECDPQCKPIIAGNSVFFGFERGTFGGAREMVIRDPESRDLTAFDITTHIPSYIPKAFQSIVAMPQENLVIFMPKLDHRYPNKEMRTLYFYKYLDRGNERVQSAWFKYELELDYDATHWAIIKNIHVSGNALYIHQGYIKRDAAGTGTSQPMTVSGSAYWKMEFTDGEVTDLHKTPPLLDNCISYLGTASSITTLTGALDGSTYDVNTLVVTVVGLENDTVIPEGATFKILDGVGGYEVESIVTVGGTVALGSVTLNVAQMGNTSTADVVEIGITATDSVSAVWDGAKTTFTLPMHGLLKDITKHKCITRYQEGVTDGGTELTIAHNAGTATTWTIDIVGTDHTETHLWFGKVFDMTYKYAHPIFKGPSAGGGASLVTSGRYQVHSADIVYSDTNTFDVAVSVEGRSDYSYNFTADTTQVDVTSEGVVGLDSGDMRIPIHAKNDTYDMTVTSSSPYPVKLLSTEFESQYNTRSRRMGI